MNVSDILDDVPDTKADVPASTADLLTSDDSGPAKESVRLSKDIAPDHAAKVLQLRDQTGLPTDFVSRNAVALKTQAENAAITPEFAQDHPAVTSYLGEDPHHAALVAGDTSTWGAVERQFGFMKNQAERGFLDTEGSVRKMMKGFGHIDPENERRIQQIDKRLQFDTNKPAPGPISNVFGHVVESGPMMIGALGVGALGAGAGIPAGIGTSAAWGAMEFGNAFQDFSNRKDAQGNPAMDEDTARGFALLSGVGQGALFALGGKVLEEIPGMKMISGPGLRSLIASPTGLTALKTIAKDIGRTGATMGGYSGLASLIHSASGHLAEMKSDGSLKDATPAAIIARILPPEDLKAAVESAKSGFLTGGVLGAAGGGMDVASDVRNYAHATQARELYHVNNYMQALHNAEGWKNIGTAIAGTKMAKLAPEQVENVISRIIPEANVFLPMEQWQSYWQSKKVDPRAAFQEVTGNTKAYDESMRTGADIQIPTPKYASKIAPSEHNEFFSQHIKSDPLAMSADEAKQSIGIKADMEKEELAARQKIAEAIAPPPGKESAPKPVDTALKVSEDVSAQLEKAGFSKDEARQQAQLYEAGFRTMGARAGVDPLELYQKYGLKIRRGGEAVNPEEAALPGSPDQRTIEQAPPGHPDTSPARAELDRSVFPGPLDPSLQRITAHPEYVKVNQEATDIVKRYAKQRGIEPTAELGKSLFKELHEALGQVRLAAPEARMALAKEMMAKYPSIDKDFVTLKDKLWMDAADGYFNIHLKSKGISENIPVESLTVVQAGAETGPVHALFAYTELSPSVRGGPLEDKYQVFGDKSDPIFKKLAWGSQYTAEQLAEAGVPITGRVPPRPSGFATRQKFAEMPGPGETKLEQAQPKNLVAIHNLTADNIQHVDKMGGLAVPSLAISRIEHPIEGFGEISLIGDKNLVDPQASRANKVFNADVYSPRYPSIHYEVNNDAIEKVWPKAKEAQAYFTNEQDPIIPKYAKDNTHWSSFGGGEIGTRGPEALKRDYWTRAMFAKEEGLPKDTTRAKLDDYIRANEDKFNAFTQDIASKVISKEKIFKGFTDLGNRRYSPHTLDNAVSELKKDLQGGEGFNYGLGSLRSTVAKRYRTLNEIKADRDKILSKESFEKAKELTNKEFDAILSEAADKYKYKDRVGVLDTFTSILSDAIKSRTSIKDDLEKYGFPGMDVDRIHAFLDTIRNMPTEYFEAKIQRAVQLEEFQGAVIPKNTPQSVRDILAKHGVEFREYDSRETGTRDAIDARQKAVQDFATELNQRKPTVLFQGGEKPIGQIRFGTNRQMNIDMLKGANMSTFLHETGHFYLEMLGDLASAADAKPDIKADFQTVLEHFGLQSREQLTKENHESWAKQFEAYLMEGKAPVAELRGPFARFKEWLTTVYQKVSNLGVQLAPKVRQVFDRMLATKEQILDAEDQQGMKPLFEDPAAFGMPPDKAARYRDAIDRAHADAQEDIVRKITDRAMREKSVAWQAERKDIQTKVEQEAAQRPEYHALEVLRGEPGAKASSGIESFKLDRQEAMESIPPGAENRYPVGIFADKGGLSADEAATILGYNSGTELLYALRMSPKLEDFVKQETDARMMERHPDTARGPNLMDRAMEAVHNDQRSRVLRLELEHLASQEFATFKGLVRAIGRRIPTIKEVRDDAEQTIGGKTTAETLPSLYQRAESTSSREAQEHFLRGDFEKAFEAKQAELRNHELYRAAVDAKEQSTKDLSFAQKFDNDAARQRIGKAGGSYLEQIDAIRQAFDFSKVTLKELGRRESLRDWVDAQTKAGFNPVVPPDLLEQAGKKSWREMSNDELHSTVDSMRNIAHLAGLKNKLLASLKERTFDETRTSIVDALTERYKITPEKLAEPYDLHPDWVKRVKGTLNSYGAWRTRMEPLFDQMGMHESIFEPMNVAEDKKNIQMRDSVKSLEDIFSVYSRKERAKFGRLTYISELEGSGLSPNLNKMEMIMSLLHAGNEGNMAEVLRGYRMTEAQLRGIWKHLEPRDVELADKVWKFVDSFWPQIAKQERELNGLPPEKIQGRPLDITLADGSVHHVAGGYFPLVYDKGVSWRTQALGQDNMVKDMFPSYASNTATRHNWTQARVGGGGQAPSLKFSVLTNHVFDVVHDLAYRKPVIDAYNLLNDPDVQAHIQAGAGKGIYAQMNPWIKRVAGDRQWEPLGPFEALRSVRSNMTVAELGLKVGSAFVHTTSLFPATQEVGLNYMAQGFKAFTNIPEATKFMWEKSDFMRSRWEDVGDRDIRSAGGRLNLVNADTGFWAEFKAMSPIEQKDGWILMRCADIAVAGPTWHGAYLKAMDGKVSGIEAMSEPEAVSYADRVVRDTKGNGSAKDLAPIQNVGGSVGKLMTMFMTQLNVIDNQMLAGYRQFKVDKSMGKMAGTAIMSWFIPAVASQLIRGRFPGDDENWAAWGGKAIAKFPFELMPLTREAMSALERGAYQISPVEEAVATIVKTFKNVALKNKLADMATGDETEWTQKDYADAMMTIGYLKGLPTRQIVQSTMRLHNWMSDEEPHDNPLLGAISVITGSKNTR